MRPEAVVRAVRQALERWRPWGSGSGGVVAPLPGQAGWRPGLAVRTREGERQTLVEHRWKAVWSRGAVNGGGAATWTPKNAMQKNLQLSK